MSKTRDDVIRQVLALTRKAERTDSTAEAEACYAKAAQLTGAWSVSQAMIDAFKPVTERTRPTRRYVTFSPNKSFLKQRAILLHIIADTGRCRMVLTSSDDRQAELFGFADDVEFVELLFTHLLTQAGREAERALAVYEHEWGTQKNRYAWRRNFYIGFNSGVHRRLKKENERVVAEARREHPGRAELVLVDRRRQVDDLVGQVYPRLQHGRRETVTDDSTYAAGRAAGWNADVSGGRKADGAAGYVGHDARAIGGR